MKTFLNINSLNQQIQQYVRRIKNRQTDQLSLPDEILEKFTIPVRTNDVRSNLNTLDGTNKFNIQKLVNNEQTVNSSEYVTEAYEHLSSSENKNKVVIDFMHKNNRNFDVSA